MQKQEDRQRARSKFEVRVPAATADAIRRLAAANERTVSGEVRLALSRHIEAEGRRDAAAA